MPISRKRLLDFQMSQWARSVGHCPSDTGNAAAVANRVQERLLTCREAGDTGWYGCYAEMAFTVDTANPILTMPRGVARLIRVTACDMPIPIRNQFYEYLEFGSGRWPKIRCGDPSTLVGSGEIQALRRNLVPTTVDFESTGHTLRFFPLDAADVGKKLVVSCLDANGQVVRTVHNGIPTNGAYVTLASPSVDLMLPDTSVQLEISEILGIQKDITVAPVIIHQVDIAAATSELILTMEAGEQVSGYARYYLDGVPLSGCCPAIGQTSGTVQVNAMVKLDFVKVQASTDYLLIQSIEAMIAEAQSMRFGDMDEPSAKAQARERHKEAIGYLNGLTVHYEGKENASVMFAPFGSARLRHQKIGTLI